MKFSVSLSEFQKALAKTLPAIPPKSTLPVLEHLKFSLVGNDLKIVATDQDITIMTVLGVSGNVDGAILVPGRKFSEIMSAQGSTGEIDFESNDDTFEIKLRLLNREYNFRGLNPNEYLDLPELFNSEKPDLTDDSVVDGLSVNFFQDDIRNAAEKTIFAVSNDEFRPAMTGTLFQFRKDYVNAVATDSYRLVKYVIRSEKEVFPEEMDIIIPVRALQLLVRVDSDVVMSSIQSHGKITHVRFDVGNTVYISRIIDEKFPPYESVIPKDNDKVVVIDKSEIEAGIKRVSILTSTISKQIRVAISENQLVLKGEDEEYGTQAEEILNCDYTQESFEIGFNFKYISDAIKNIDSDLLDENKIYLTFSEPTRPALIKPDSSGDNLLMLIMPVRLS